MRHRAAPVSQGLSMRPRSLLPQRSCDVLRAAAGWSGAFPLARSEARPFAPAALLVAAASGHPMGWAWPRHLKQVRSGSVAERRHGGLVGLDTTRMGVRLTTVPRSPHRGPGVGLDTN